MLVKWQKKIEPYVIKKEDLRPYKRKLSRRDQALLDEAINGVGVSLSKRAEMLVKEDDEELFLYNHNGRDIVLMKKKRPYHVGRILGALHLQEKGTEYAIPQKFLIAPPEGLENAKVTVFLPSVNEIDQCDAADFGDDKSDKCLVTDLQQTSTRIDFQNTELYVEYILGYEVPGVKNEKIGLLDAYSNVIENKSNGQKYLIDTADDKNFDTPIKDCEKAYQVKALHFAPHLKTVTIDLAKS